MDVAARTRTYLMLSFALLMIQAMIGVTVLTTGIMAFEHDSAAADDMLEVIRQTDEGFYQRLTDPADQSYRTEFNEQFTRRGDPVLIGMGTVLTALSLAVMAVLVVAFTANLPAAAEGADDDDEASESESDEQTF